MARVREWLSRLWATLHRGRDERDIAEEMRLHLELAAENEEPHAGSLESARRAARIRVGDVTRAMDAVRDQRGLPWLEDFLHDVRFGLRAVRRTPAFAAVIVMSLALGIGANSALFSLIDATLLRELSVGAPEELVQLRWQLRGDWFPDRARFAGSGSIGGFGVRRSPTFSNAAFDALLGQPATPSELFAFSRLMPVTASIGHQPGASTVQLVSGGYFAGLRVGSAIGRVLGPDDDSPASEPAAVISHQFWRRRFNSNPGALGTVVALDGTSFTIVGVAAETFRGVAAAGAPGPDLWVPRAFGSRFGAIHAEPGFWWLSVMGRLHPGTTAEHLRDALAGAFRAAVRETDTPPVGDGPELRVSSARRGATHEGPEDELEHAVILGLIFGILLLVVCLNVANLLLSRSAARQTEIAVRLALGASRGRLVRQMLAESVTLATAGGVLGLVLAYWGTELFGASTIVPRGMDLRIDGLVFGSTLMLSAFTGVIFGLMPALRATRQAKAGAIGGAAIKGAPASRLNRSLLVTQVAISVVLLAGAGLFVRTLAKWKTIDTGFDARNLLVFQIDPASIRADDARAADLRDRIATRIRAVPGVTAVTTSGAFWKDQWFGRFFINGERRRPIPHYLSVRHDFFQTLGIRTLSGRSFTADEDDKAGPPAVAVIDQVFARQFFGDASPIGHRVAFQENGSEVEIVGVVGNMRLAGTRPEEVRPRIYLPEHTRRSDFDPESTKLRAAYRLSDETSFLIRTAADPMSVLPAVRAAVSEVEPDLALLDPGTVANGIQEKLSPTRVASLIWLSFGGVTLALTAVGLYGLLAYSVVQRTREIGIRTALGARRSDIIRLVTGPTSVLVVIGIAIGVVVSMGVGGLLRAFIFGVTFYDPLTMVAVVSIIGVVTGLAALLPARRASRVDPTVALRWQ